MQSRRLYFTLLTLRHGSFAWGYQQDSSWNRYSYGVSRLDRNLRYKWSATIYASTWAIPKVLGTLTRACTAVRLQFRFRRPVMLHVIQKTIKDGNWEIYF